MTTVTRLTPPSDDESGRPLIVAVDDEADVLRLLQFALNDEGFDVIMVQRSVEAVAAIRFHHPAVVLLDLMMPEMDGLSVLDQIRAFSTVPVIILTARGAGRDVVVGLDRGADDYLAKPFSIGELAARVRAVIRRTRPDAASNLGAVEFGPLKVDFVRRTVRYAAVDIHLTRNEWRLLEQFARNPGRVLSHEELLSRAWGPQFGRDVDYLRVWLSRLRRKLTEAGADPNLIRTASGMGYAFGLEMVDEGARSVS
ncbi:MAG: response regulator transcription factor [Dehalococcoidia bacterium]